MVKGGDENESEEEILMAGGDVDYHEGVAGLGGLIRESCR